MHDSLDGGIEQFAVTEWQVKNRLQCPERGESDDPVAEYALMYRHITKSGAELALHHIICLREILLEEPTVFQQLHCQMCKTHVA